MRNRYFSLNAILAHCGGGGGGRDSLIDPICNLFNREDSVEPHQKLLRLDAWDSASRIRLITHQFHGRHLVPATDSAHQQVRLFRKEVSSWSFCSFDDTMDIEGKQVAGEPDSSEEEERERQDMRWAEKMPIIFPS